MLNTFYKALSAVAVYAMFTAPAHAQSAGGWYSWFRSWVDGAVGGRTSGREANAVPEIDASTGLLTLAAVAAALALAYEINRRRKSA
ncbi:hypothetical protein ROJ8625_01206 [Roseivivax jejudonensis]|uniref:VPEID-CTERM protein sorting domain protein n=1 Tax=Roseivivax jejudonensis TaxID=1529041 RepID=A0A1X6YQJ9_9RHOB|nr:VPEID-CTERM sorting domain-containing protein [Roseivivax jejudonensis]SLN28481.1 hypothetical protein ROJ8625_01206 [Roseivivax jejudonensis]